MPVPVETYDSEIDLTPGTTKSDVVRFLYRNDDYGYSPREITDELAIPHNTAKVTLKRLFDDEYIDKTPDGYYYARSDREDLYRYSVALVGLDRMFTTHEDSRDVENESDADVDTDLGEPATLTDEDIAEAVALVDSDPDEDRE